jgi:hypothetical protein
MRPRVAVPLVALAVIGFLHPALARERLVVVVSVRDDQELADNLSEVVIARLSSSTHHELVGQRELGERLLELDAFSRGGARACVGEPRCVAGIGALAKAELAVMGSVDRRKGRFSIELSLVETRTGLRRGVVLETDDALLLTTLEEGVDRLFPRASAQSDGVSSMLDAPTNPLFAYAAAGLALLTLSAALLTKVTVARKRLFVGAAVFTVGAVVAYFSR